MIKQETSLLLSMGLFFTILLQLMSIPALARDKTDVVILKNGDRVTGEIKSLDRGKMSLSTDHMGTIQIEWVEVAQVTSQWVFEVETETGLRTIGTLAPAAEPEMIQILGEDSRKTLNQTSVVKMTQLEAGFLARLEGYVDLGFSFARANRATEWTLGAEVKSHNAIRQIRANLSSLFSDRKDVESNTRNVLNLDWTRFFSNRWLATGLGRFTQNQELDLDLRSTFGGTVGRHLLHSNKSTFILNGGAVFTREKFTVDDPDDPASIANSIEALAIVQYQLFNFGDPETDIVVSFSILPSLSDWGRFRMNFDTRIRYELFKDFFWSVSAYDQYDSRPPEGTERNDFGVNTSVGWSF